MPQSPLFNRRESARHSRWRLFKDRLLRRLVALGGSTVLVAISLIFFYLLYVVTPLFLPASVSFSPPLATPAQASPTLHLALEQQGELAVRYQANGEVEFFDPHSGLRVADFRPVSAIDALVVAAGDPELVALRTPNQMLQLVRQRVLLRYDTKGHRLDASLETLGPPHRLPAQSTQIALQADARQIRLVVQDLSARLSLLHLSPDASEPQLLDSLIAPLHARYLQLTPDGRRLFLVDRFGRLLHYRVEADQLELVEGPLNLLDDGARLSAFGLLAGGHSLLVGDDRGMVRQWFTVRDAQGTPRLRPIRRFSTGTGAVEAIVPERWRKVFAVLNDDGTLSLFHATAERKLLQKPLPTRKVRRLALAPRGDAALVEAADGSLQSLHIDNPHPEISWRALWGEVHYEHYPAADAVWQSSAASSLHEPKFSLAPLLFGTFKAALFALLLAIPLALFGAIYTGYFMQPGMRRVVKPTIEMLEALPTVIIGLLAGLLLAPLLETGLPGFLLLLPGIPLLCLLAALLWWRLPARLRVRIPHGWEAALLIPVLLLGIPLLFALGSPLESWLFDGNLRGWLSREWGLDYNQRNALVVGVAMGFAVVPTIFSIAEDAIYNVPPHLTYGSLALGASRWQTLLRVVVPTASPGLFSAVMIGLGRAVGETMIVLMATGNTPVMDLSLFEGLRSLSANIAIELPEAELHSSHYRVLFLAALVLFLVTFVFNTLADLVRQRLRRQYGRL